MKPPEKKFIVSVGVPTLYYGFSMIDYWVNGAKISYWLADTIANALGVVTTGLVTLVLALITRGMIRRTALK